MGMERMASNDASIEDKIKIGILSPDEARGIQTRATGVLRDDNKGGWVVDMKSGGTEEFENQADALQWVNRTGGLILRPNGEVAAGERIEDILARIGKS